MSVETFLALADQGIVSVTSFVTSMILARSCSKEEFGVYALGLTIIGLVTECQNVLIWSPYTIYSPRLRDSEFASYKGSFSFISWLYPASPQSCWLSRAP